MDAFSFSLGLLAGVAVVCCCSLLPEYLARRNAKKKIKDREEQIEFKREVVSAARCMVSDEIRQCKREMVSYINSKLAEMDKHEESREEDKHE